MPLSDEEHSELLIRALEARKASYSPYSKFRVGACLLTDSGEYVSGCNVESASYGATICAERTALVKAVSEGHTKFRGLAVSSDLEDFCSPCGICRQLCREFLYLDTPILMVTANYDPQSPAQSAKEILEVTLDQLLPLSFGPEDLAKGRNLI